MESLRQLFITLGLDWDASGFAAATLAADALKAVAAKLVEAFKALADVVRDSVLETAHLADQLADAAVRTGATVAALQELGYAAGLSGSSSEGLTLALTRLAHTAQTAAAGNKEAAETFAKLGVRVVDSSGKLRATDELFTDLADALGKLKNPTERAALAIEVFGRNGAELLPLLAEGAEGIERMRQEARDLGLVMGDSAQAAQFADNLDKVSFFAQSLKHDLGLVLIEGLAPLVDGFLEWVKANRALLKSGIVAFGRALGGVLKALTETLAGMAKALLLVIEHWRVLAVFLGSVLFGLMVAFKAQLLEMVVAWALNGAAALAYAATSVWAAVTTAAAWLAASAPVILLVALFGLLALAVEDVLVFLEGGDSVLGSLGRKWAAFVDDWLASEWSGGDPWWLTAVKAVVWLLTDLQARFPASVAEWTQLFVDWKNLIVRFFTVDIPNAVKSFLGGTMIDPIFGDGPQVSAASLLGLSPSADVAASQAAANVTNASTRNNLRANFVVQAAPGQEPEEVARAVQTQLSDWWGAELQAVVPAAQGG